MRRNPTLVAGAAMVGIVVALALVSVVWTPWPATQVSPDRLWPPGSAHLMGTDGFGQDIFSRVLIGARSCLLVGVVAVTIGALLGVPLGVVAAIDRGVLGRVLMRASDILYAFPALLLAILLAAARGQGSTLTAMTAIGISSIPAFARVARGATLQVLSQDYVLAARASGIRRTTIAVRHVLPNILPVVVVQASVSFGLAILAEASLSYLGLGTPPTTPSWGRMIFEAQPYMYSDLNLAIWPGLFIAIAVLGFNLLGDGLRDLLDPTLREVER
ncbi:ABC transporter permease [Brooklawnia cerclae]|uniref:Peptide/nickel transport system permease protein n=1 Tax=Brooklawnia cerclae TaxID=349934 RepID=A0ABX0SDC2_9ACTN|nr:ABC transporter permease [Brooklawnia cerclae]NIH56397.1 peptide/nickel transport system permease protein [Brooklawnia cerclae]